MLKQFELISYMQRRGPGALPELLQEISQIVEAAFQTDLRYLQIGFLQKALCLLDPVFIDVFDGGMPDYFLKSRQKYCSFRFTWPARSDMYILLW